MKKKTTKSKKSVAPKPAAMKHYPWSGKDWKAEPAEMKLDYDGHDWKAEPITDEQLRDLIHRLEEEKSDLSTTNDPLPINDPIPMSVHPNNLYGLRDTMRIVVVVAETLTYEKDGVPYRYKMETGRQMAQACHAVSGLKLDYISAHSAGDDSKAKGIVNWLSLNPITTIVLKARDSEEIQHILYLAEEKNLLHFSFADENKEVYGTDQRILSAIAIGPLSSSLQFSGITDYLPLWQD